jgi:hypothetical protein
MTVTAALVASFFDPSLEGAQTAALLWIAFGIGLVVTNFRWGFGDRDISLHRSTAVVGSGTSSVHTGMPASSRQPLR